MNIEDKKEMEDKIKIFDELNSRYSSLEEKIKTLKRLNFNNCSSISISDGKLNITLDSSLKNTAFLNVLINDIEEIKATIWQEIQSL